MKVALVCIAKDEEKYIEEWIDYHLKLGFDEIFIYENDWSWNSEQENPRIHIIKCNNQSQDSIYNDFIPKCHDDFDFAAFISPAEFISLKCSSIKDCLMICKTQSVIPVKIKFFGDSGKKLDGQDFSVLSRFIKSQKGSSDHLRFFINFKEAGKNLQFKNGLLPVASNENENSSFSNIVAINHYLCTKEEHRNLSGLGDFDKINEIANEEEDKTALTFYEDVTPDEIMKLWYDSSNSLIRRFYFRTPKCISVGVKTAPSYPPDEKDLKVGVVIGTYEALPYVDLGLHWLKKENGIDDILIHDDHSPDAMNIKRLADEYGVDFFSTPEKMPYIKNVSTLGDASCIYEGLKWAKRKNLDILVKFSRRLIPCFRWIDNFKKLVLQSDGITFSSRCVADHFPMRTEAFGMNVNAWSNDFILENLEFYISSKIPMHAEFWFSEMAKMLDHQNFSRKYYVYTMQHYKSYDASGYVDWRDVLGTNRYNKDNRNQNVLWHMYSTPEDYWKASEQALPGKYRIEDFQQ